MSIHDLKFMNPKTLVKCIVHRNCDKAKKAEILLLGLETEVCDQNLGMYITGVQGNVNK